MKASDTLIKKLKEFEGLRLTAYKCQGGKWTIGYGHTLDVRAGQSISKKQADEFLEQDLKEVEAYVSSIEEISTQGQFDAVADFVFNLGALSFGHSTLYKCIKEKKGNEVIAKQFRRWIYAGGQKSAGLIKRRNWEATRWAQKK